MLRLLAYILFAGLLIFVCRYHYKHPRYNWDMLPYMAVVLGYDHTEDVHRQIYSTAKKEIPQQAFHQLTDSTNKYRWSVFQSAQIFTLQLPYYVVKPLYTGLAFIFYKSGIPLTKATVLPSLISFFFIGILFFYWLQKYLPVIVAMIAAAAIAVWGPIMAVAGLSSPDGVSALILLAACFCLVENKNPAWVYVLAFISIFARIDNILPAVFLIFFMIYKKRSEGPRPWITGTIAAAACIVCYLAVGMLAKEYNWNMLYFSNYFSRMNPEYEVQDTFTMQNYWALIKSQSMSGLYYSQLPLFFFLSVCIITYRWKVLQQRNHPEIFLIAGIWLIIFLRFILHPMAADRIYLAYYLVILLLLVKSMHAHVLSSGVRND